MSELTKHEGSVQDTLRRVIEEQEAEIERLRTAADMDSKIILKLARDNERLRANVEQMEAAIRSHVGEPTKPPTGDHAEQLGAAMQSYNTRWGNAAIESEKVRAG